MSELNNKSRVEYIFAHSNPTVDEMIKWLRKEDISAQITFSSDTPEIDVEIYIYNHWDECQEMHPFSGQSLEEIFYEIVIWIFDDN